MGVRKIALAQGRRMPWRNGGGVTTELAIEPADVALSARFLYRVSVADIATSGPFSRFDGYDRHIVLVLGLGMHIDCGAHGALALRFGTPHTFSGDWDVRGDLVNGPVRDFNVIVDRSRARSSFDVRVLDAPLDCPAGTTLVVHWLDGAFASETWITDESLPLPALGARAAIARIDVS